MPNGDDQMEDPVPLGRTGLGLVQIANKVAHLLRRFGLAPSPGEDSACDYVLRYVMPVSVLTL